MKLNAYKIITVLIMFIMLSVSASAALTDDIQYYWKFDDDDSTQVDSVGNMNGSVTSATYTASSKINGGYIYDGSDDKITMGNAVYHDFSVTAWINYTADATQHHIMSTNIGAYTGWAFMLDDDRKLRLYRHYNGGSGNYQCKDDVVLAEDKWWHVAMVIDNSTVPGGTADVFFYINGQLNTTCSNVKDNNDYTTLIVGAAQWFKGEIDEVGFWNRSLGSAEIAEIYNDGDGFQYPFTPQVIGLSNWNVTSDGGDITWRTSQLDYVFTSDPTPTMTFDTVQSASCRIGVTDSNYTTMTSARNCTTTGGTSHVCTLTAADALSSARSSLYIACNYDENSTSDSGALNIKYQLDPQITVHTVVNETTGIGSSVLLNVTITDSYYDELNITFYNADDNSVLCSNNSLANNTQITYNWQTLKFNTTYNWGLNVTNGFTYNDTKTLTFNTSEVVMRGTTKDGDGNIMGLSTVIIINQSSDSILGTTTSDTNGNWSYNIDYADTYLVLGYNKTDASLGGDIYPHIVIT